MTTLKLDTAECDRIISRLGINKKQIGKRIAFEIEVLSRIKAPYKTGALINSIYTVTQDSDGYGAASAAAKGKNPDITTTPHPQPSGNVIARVGPCVDYAEYQEFGTSRMAAHPYLTPAAESVSNKYNSGDAWKELTD